MNYEKNQKRNQVVSHLRCYSALVLLTCLLLTPNRILAQDKAGTGKISGQEITVKGKVLDSSNTPVIGATILLNGSKTGTITDIDGNFSLKVPLNSMLKISYIGYATQKVKVTNKSMTIVMAEDGAKLDEVVVVGYGTVKKTTNTGSVSSITMKGLSDISVPNFGSALMGTMAGVHVDESTGNPVGTTTIHIRTAGTWNAQDPLYVIDGFIHDTDGVDAFNRLDASEVESISVLKDAAAAIYGVRGAGGVILITTKRGKVGKTNVSYSSSYGVSQGIQMPQMMSAYQQGVALNDLWQQQITYQGADAAKIKMFTADELEQMKGLDYNWLSQAWKSAVNTRHTINVSGGTEDVRYFVGGSYQYQDGNFKGLDMNRYGIRLGVDANLTKNLKGSFSLDYNSKALNQPLNAQDTQPDQMYGTFSSLARNPRWIPAYINGLAVGNSLGGSNSSNPLEVISNGSTRQNKSDNITSSASFEYSVPKLTGLKLSLSANYAYGGSTSLQIAKPYTLYNFQTIGDTHLISDVRVPITNTAGYAWSKSNGDHIYQSANTSYSYQLTPKITYDAKFGKNSISAMLVYEQSEAGGNGLTATRSTMIIDNYNVMTAFSTAAELNNSTINNVTRRQSFISRLNYNFNEKYMVEATARYEASTNFAPGYRWGLFPSIAGAWRISEESFFKDNVSFMDNLKLRLSYGRLGNDQASGNQWRESYGATSGVGYTGGSAINTVLYPNLSGLVLTNSTWEKSDKYNVGLDMKMFKDFTVGIDAFYAHQFDILDMLSSTFPQSSGVGTTTPKANFGIQNAWGSEFEIGYNKQLNKDWSIRVKGNFAYSTNKVIKKNENPGVVGTWQDEMGRIRGGGVGYTSEGIARTQDQVNAYIAELKANTPGGTGTVAVLGVPSTSFAPGMLMFKDLGSPAYQDADGKWHDGKPDGQITTDDYRTINKYDSAPYTYGFSLGFTWKSFSVDALFNGQFGNNVFFEKAFYTANSGGGRAGDFLSETSNQLSIWSGNYWTANNVNAPYPRLDSYSFAANPSTFWMRDGSTLRLRNLNVSYALPAKFSKKLGIDQFRVFASGTNIWTIINPFPYKDASVGFWSDYPMVQTFNLGLNLNF
ncbi:MAG: TonB-dependent receptor [Paludibacter sp.]